MESPAKTRAEWAELPSELHRLVADLLGGEVVATESQTNGFSPGSADRVRTAAGERAFVKAVSRAQNDGAYSLHLREAAAMERMPKVVRAPKLLGSFVTEEWAGLVLQDISGVHPGGQLDGGDVDAVLDALASFPPLPADDAETLLNAAEEFAGDAEGWQRLDDEGALSELPEWAQASIGRIREAASRVASVAAGEYLQHLDCRADNILLDSSGEAWVIDWPWAGVGARWTDGACYLFDVRMRGEDVDVDGILQRHPLFDGVTDDDIDSLLAALTGGYLFRSRLPAPPNMPTLRDFQRREGLTGLAWLQERWG